MTLRSALLVTALGVAALGVTACGGGGGGAGPGPGVVAPAPPPPAPPPPAPPPPPPPSTDAESFETAEYQRQTGLTQIHASSAYAQGATGDGIIVAVIDSGVHAEHPDLIGRISNLSTDIAGERGPGDVDGHGTAVSGVIAANKNDRAGHGVAYESRVISIRADTPGSCEADGGEGCTFSDANIARAIDYAVANGARVINMSLGRDADASDDRTLVFTALRDAVRAGVFIVVSAGNRDEEEAPNASPGFPANFAAFTQSLGFAVAVGSVDGDNVISDFSSRALGAETTFLVAPGERILTPTVDSETGETQFAYYYGTSFAAPHVAGALALLLDAFPNLQGNEALSILFETAVDLGASGPDAIYGMGLIDLEAAFRPVGATSVAMAESEPVAVTALFSPPRGASGDWVWASGLLDDAILRDKYDRAFNFSPEAVTLAPDRALTAMSATAENQLRRTAQTRVGGTTASLRLSPETVAPLSNLPSETYHKDSDFMLAFNQGPAQLQVGRGFYAPGPMAGAGVSTLTQNVFSGAAVNLVSPRNWMSAGVDLGRFSLMSRLGESEDGQFSAISALFELDRHALAVETGQTTESDHLLGDDLGYRFGGDSAARTQFVAVQWRSEFTPQWSAAARVEWANTQAQLPSGLSPDGRVQASAWSLGVERTLASGALGVTLSQPLRVEQGSVIARVPVRVDRQGLSLYEIRKASLTPSGRELAVETAWRYSLGERAILQIAAQLRHQPGHVAQLDNEGLIWLHYKTQW